MLRLHTRASHIMHDLRRAGDGARTRDIKLGRLALYQLSYSRERTAPLRPHRTRLLRRMVGEGFEPSKALAGRFTVCSRWPLGYPTRSSRAPALHDAIDATGRADGENRTRNRLITNQVLCQLSYVSRRPFLRETRRIVGRGESVKRARRRRLTSRSRQLPRASPHRASSIATPRAVSSARIRSASAKSRRAPRLPPRRQIRSSIHAASSASASGPVRDDVEHAVDRARTPLAPARPRPSPPRRSSSAFARRMKLNSAASASGPFRSSNSAASAAATASSAAVASSGVPPSASVAGRTAGRRSRRRGAPPASTPPAPRPRG